MFSVPKIFFVLFSTEFQAFGPLFPWHKCQCYRVPQHLDRVSLLSFDSSVIVAVAQYIKSSNINCMSTADLALVCYKFYVVSWRLFRVILRVLKSVSWSLFHVILRVLKSVSWRLSHVILRVLKSVHSNFQRIWFNVSHGMNLKPYLKPYNRAWRFITDILGLHLVINTEVQAKYDSVACY